MTHPVKAPKKLIEVALPLDAINVASAREKSIRHGHPSTLHLWWARRPLAAARAVIFSQMVNDPSWKWELEHPGEIPPNHLKATWAKSRNRLFKIIEDLVLWENTTNEPVLEKAREEIRKSWRETCELNKDHTEAATLFNPDKLPGLHDPFAGGGAIPLEAQRLGLEAYASDLNPVAVLINKAMIEIPPKFAGKPPVNPEARKKFLGASASNLNYRGAQGLAEDVRYYGQWMRDEAEKRIGHLYPKVEITKDMAKDRPDLKPLVGEKLTVIAWLWARTVKSPNPAYSQVDVPLASTFMLCTKKGKEAYVEPVIGKDGFHFAVRLGSPKNPEQIQSGTKLARANFRCVMSGVAISGDYIKEEGKAGRMGECAMAVVVEGPRGRVYLPSAPEMERTARGVKSAWQPDVEISGSTQYLGIKPYGMTLFSHLFLPRQLGTLNTFGELAEQVRTQVVRDALTALGSKNLAERYADAIGTYLGLCVSRQANRSSTLNFWDSQGENVQQVFARQALSMTWDFVEGNPLSQSTGNISGQFDYLTRVLETSCSTAAAGVAIQHDAQTQTLTTSKVVCTDPPYYDNVPYADLSDFFYVWLRRALRDIEPKLFATVAVPKAEELVAFAYRHDGKAGAEAFFLNGMTHAMHQLAVQVHPAFPTTIFYAFRQAETDDDSGTSSTGWDTFLDSVIRAGFGISGTWPMRTEYTGNLKTKRNALASSIVIVCRPRSASAPTTARREFLRELNAVLPEALDEMTRGSDDETSPVAPVDLSQAIIGPGMAVFSKYAAVLEADGTPMSVRTALQLINRFLAEDDFDGDTQFCLRWFEQHSWENGAYGEAEVLSKAKSTSVDGLKAAGVVASSGGKLRLLKYTEYPEDWNPEQDDRLPIWEVLHHLIRALKQQGESGAGRVLAVGNVRGKAEAARQLAYRLYTLCERAGRAEDARAYNELVTSWNAIEVAAGAEPKRDTRTLFDKQK